MKKYFTILVFLFITISVFAQDVQYVFPDDAGLIDVTKDPYNADNSGATDATAAIQAALDAYPSANRIIYLPNGTYLISNTLSWPEGSGGGTFKRTILQGESKNGVIIQLKDNCPGFQDPENRKAMIYTGPAPAQRFRNSIYTLTVNTGTGNPGAAGIQFNCSNEGTMQHVNIISGDGQGVHGLDLDFTNEIGPGYIYDLMVEGFDFGIRHGYAINSMTFENIRLLNQNICGFFNEGNVSPIRGFISDNSVTAIQNNWIGATMILIDAELNGGADTIPAIRNAGTLYARNIRRIGYEKTIASSSGLAVDILDPYVKEYNSHSLYRQFPSPVNSLNLPVKDWPEVPWSDLSQWANVITYGAVGDGSTNDSKAIQAAIDAGKETVYLPGGYNFKMDDTVYLRANVRRFIGCEGRLTGNGTLIIEDEIADTLVIERINALYAQVDILNRSSKTLVVNSQTGMEIKSDGSGDMFLLNNVFGVLELQNPDQDVWIRHLNTEEGDETNVINNGADLWILGYKTERGKTKIHTTNGGKTELLGVHNYSTSTEKTDPWFVIEDASMSIAGARETNFNNAAYSEYVKETRGEETKTINRSAFPPSGLGAGVIPLYTGYAVNGDLPPAPSSLSFVQKSAGIWTISWEPVNAPEFDYYSIYYSEDPAGPFRMISNYIEEPGYDYEALSYGNYYFVVTAVDNNGLESEYSEVLEAVVPQPPAPEAPAGLTATAGDSFNTISWEPNAELSFDHYELYRALPPGTFFVLMEGEIRDTFYVDESLVSGKTHFYTLKAVNIYGDKSVFSDTISVFPLNTEENFSSAGKNLQLYPNPAGSFLKILSEESMEYTFQIIDISGRVQASGSLEQNHGELDISGLDPGNYVIRLVSGRKVEMLRFIKIDQ